MMDSVSPTDPDPQHLASPHTPYVGLRPYRRGEGDLIFGRRADAQLLRNKLLSAPLTLLYAPSGVGKTSVLAALVIPALSGTGEPTDEDAAAVIYFEQWEVARPLASLKAQVAALGPAGLDGNTELAPLLNAVVQGGRRQTLVLILDQFEQFLIRHPEQIEALGRELGSAVRLARRCHIVLSLREEFLGSLEP